MPNNEEMVAMILAGGRGTRLKSLTSTIAKPAVYFGGKYRIIDFPLSNVANSGIHTVGVLTQYESSTLNNYIGSGRNWGLNGTNALASILPPRETPNGANWYSGTADAIYQNIDWLDKTKCEYVVILSGDHIYKMDYSKMLDYHKKMGADCTIAVIDVPLEEASRFGIMSTVPDTLAAGEEIYFAGAKLTESGETVTSGGRVLGAVATGGTLPEALDRAYALADRIHFANAYCRRDIGARALAADVSAKETGKAAGAKKQ